MSQLDRELVYEDQKPEAARRAKSFRESRMPKYLQWFERILERNGTGHLVGRQIIPTAFRSDSLAISLSMVS